MVVRRELLTGMVLLIVIIVVLVVRVVIIVVVVVVKNDSRWCVNGLLTEWYLVGKHVDRKDGSTVVKIVDILSDDKYCQLLSTLPPLLRPTITSSHRYLSLALPPLPYSSTSTSHCHFFLSFFRSSTFSSLNSSVSFSLNTFLIIILHFP